MEQSSEQTRWVRIELGAIRFNYQQIRAQLKPQVRVLAVVKGEAYGHGAVEVSRLLEGLGANMLGVTTVAEGVELRRNGLTAPILVFGPFLPEEATSIILHDLTATIASLEAINWLGTAAQELCRQIPVHFKLETGMGRTGLWPEEIVTATSALTKFPELQLEGIYTHLATAAWADSSYANQQFKLFQQMIIELETCGYTGLLRHIANSAALLKYPHMHLDMVRTGTLLYGQYPTPSLEKTIQLEDPWSFQAKVNYIRELPAGHSVGYGRTYTTTKPTRVAVIPVGFSDGLQMEPVLKPVNLLEVIKGSAKLLLQYLGHSRMDVPIIFPAGRGRIIGKIGMQLSMVDITGIQGIEIGTVANIPLRRTAVNPLIAKVFVDAQMGAEIYMEINS